MSRRRFYIPGTAGGAGSPVVDPIAVQRQNLAVQREDLSERKFAQQTQDSADRLSLTQESNLLRKAQMVLDIVKARQSIEDKRDETLHAAAIIDKMGNLNVNAPDYEKKRAEILSQHAAGLTLAQKYVTQKDSVWEAQQKANQTKAEAFAPANIGKAGYDLTTTIKGLDSLAQQFIHKGQPVPPELQAAKTNFTKLAAQIGEKALNYNQPVSAAVQSLASAPAATAALGSAQPPTTAAPATAPVPTATPTAAPTSPATAVATDDATKFLQSIGVGAPAPASQPAAQPTQAASSGLPDTANAALSAAPNSQEEADNNQPDEE